MLFIVSAVGIVAAFVIGLDGLMLGSAGELERIMAIACFAFAAAGLVGVLADDGRRARKPHRDRVEGGGVFQAIAAAPIVLCCGAVFLATMIPALYLMLPFFVLSWPFAARRPAEEAAAPAVGRPLQVPAYP
jgi:hypothetical protein